MEEITGGRNMLLSTRAYLYLLYTVLVHSLRVISKASAPLLVSMLHMPQRIQSHQWISTWLEVGTHSTVLWGPLGAWFVGNSRVHSCRECHLCHGRAVNESTGRYVEKCECSTVQRMSEEKERSVHLYASPFMSFHSIFVQYLLVSVSWWHPTESLSLQQWLQRQSHMLPPVLDSPNYLVAHSI